jgi:hypothetical protein
LIPSAAAPPHIDQAKERAERPQAPPGTVGLFFASEHMAGERSRGKTVDKTILD